MKFQYIFLLFFGMMSFAGMSQADCVLGVGITEDEIIADVFQMNEGQREQLANKAAELKYRNEILNNQLENIYKRHPQNTVEELNQLAVKYRGVMDSMELIQTMIDKEILSLFNEKQYKLYLELCKEASRSPYIVVPKVYGDSIPVKQE